MSWENEIQKISGMFSDVGGLVESGVSIFGKARAGLFPGYSQSPPAPTPAPTPEPIAAAPMLGGIPLSLDNPMVIIAAIAVGYFLLKK